MKLILLVSLLTSLTFAQEKVPAGYDPVRDEIADNYEAGEFLIYDCEEKHWTCVLETYFKSCQMKAKEDEAKELATQYSCVPFDKYPTKKSCFQEMLFLTSNNFGTRFCLKKEVRQKAI